MNISGRPINIPYNTAFVVNPTSGAGNAGKVWPQIAELLDYSGQRYKVYFTRFHGDGSNLAAKAVREGAELVVAVGGDGTLREVVNGIEPDQTVFAVIPLGTGNGFRRGCGLPGQWQSALYGLGQWQPRKIDLGVINGSYFLNVAGIGFDAAVAEMASDKYRKVKGYTAYLMAFFDELQHFDHFSAKIAGQEWEALQHDALLILAANGPYYGAGFKIAPDAAIDDGKLDLIIIRKLNNPETTLLAFQAMVGRHLNHQAVISAKVKEVHIEADHQVPLHIDGEITGKLPVQISVKAGALRIIAPTETKDDR